MTKGAKSPQRPAHHEPMRSADVRAKARAAPDRADYLVGAVDIIGMPAAIACFIWFERDLPPWSTVVLPLWLLASFRLHHDSLASLGLRVDNLGPATRNAAVAFAIGAAALVVIGVMLHRPLALPLNFQSPLDLVGYTASCVGQQLALNSLVMNRLLRLVATPWVAAVTAGTIFSVLHWPNPVLVPCTLVAGTAMAWLFSRHRNILPLVAAHALLGTLVAWAFPASWHHELRVGPAYYEESSASAERTTVIGYVCRSSGLVAFASARPHSSAS